MNSPAWNEHPLSNDERDASFTSSYWSDLSAGAGPVLSLNWNHLSCHSICCSSKFLSSPAVLFLFGSVFAQNPVAFTKAIKVGFCVCLSALCHLPYLLLSQDKRLPIVAVELQASCHGDWLRLCMCMFAQTKAYSDQSFVRNVVQI